MVILTFTQEQIIAWIVIAIKLCISVAIGLCIGKERKSNDKPGGRRTLAIISMASCLIAILTLKLTSLNVNFNFTRLLSYGIASIGFMANGVIQHRDKKIDGLTTASCAWCLVPLNYLIGLGYYGLGIFASLLLYLILESKSEYKKKRKIRAKSKSKITRKQAIESAKIKER